MVLRILLNSVGLVKLAMNTALFFTPVIAHMAYNHYEVVVAEEVVDAAFDREVDLLPLPEPLVADATSDDPVQLALVELENRRQEMELAKHTTVDSEFRVTGAMLRGLANEKKNRRRTRGKGIAITGGRRIRTSSLHSAAIEKLAKPGFQFHNQQSVDQLYDWLMGIARRDGFTIVFVGGEQVKFPPSPVPPPIASFCALHAVSHDAETLRLIEAAQVAGLKTRYRVLWESWARQELNVVGVPAWLRLRICFGELKLHLGLSAALPPRH